MARDYVEYVPRKNKSTRKLGFWEFCAIGVLAGAAVKITRELTKDKKPDKVDISDEEIEKAAASDTPCDYVILKEKKLVKVAKAKVKIMELMDLYGCCTEHEILDVLGYEDDEEGLEHKVFDKTTKFQVRFENGDYVLYSQAPRLVMEEAENGESSGDEGVSEESVSGS